MILLLVPIIGGDVDTGVVDVPKHVDSLCDGEAKMSRISQLSQFQNGYLVKHQDDTTCGEDRQTI